MSQAIAVAIVHGSGYKEPDFADDITATLQKRFPEHLPKAAFSRAELVVEPVYWADLTHEVEEQVWQRVVDSGPMNHMDLRRFIFNFAGDTLAYQPSAGRQALYHEVHRVMGRAFERLAARAGPDAPLCIVAHSMGTIVAHNYIYDMQNEGADSNSPRPEAPLEAAKTLALFVTYGSPIAIWRLRFGEDYRAIRFPGTALDTLYPKLAPRWLNIYDADDVIGYPISQLSDAYRRLAEAGYLEDREKNVGNWFKSWNPLSHKGYLRDTSSLDDLAGEIAAIWQGAYLDTAGSS